MDTKLMIQSTPNPNALKFVLNVPVKTGGNVTYKSREDCEYNPLALAVFSINDAIKEVYFYDNYITVTQSGSADWDDLEEDIQKVILENISSHDPDFKVPVPEKEDIKFASNDDPQVAQINAILDQTVRPALQMDGGDLQIVGVENKVVRIFYQGACGSCPSATMGTMQAIENILKDQYDPAVTVELADTF